MKGTEIRKCSAQARAMKELAIAQLEVRMTRLAMALQRLKDVRPEVEAKFAEELEAAKVSHNYSSWSLKISAARL